MTETAASVAARRGQNQTHRRSVLLTPEEIVELRVPRGTAVPHRGSLWASLPAVPAMVLLLLLLGYASFHADAVRAMVWRVVGHSFRRPVTVPAARVWVRTDTGNFYCRGSVLFGSRPGQLLDQPEALTLGYQPATGTYCAADPARPDLSAHNTAR